MNRLSVLCGVFILLLSVADVEAADTASPKCISPTKQTNIDPLKLYGDQIKFRVDRNGVPVGFHRIEFKKSDNSLIVKTHFELKISFLFFTAYQYSYRSESIWQGNCLISLAATTDDDGEVSVVQARLDKGQMTIKGPKGTITAQAGVYPTNHWHPGILSRDRILNTITGRMNRIKITNKGEAAVVINGKNGTARHYVYTGELKNELWYDHDGRWVKMRFPGNDGSTIEYFCQQCRKNDEAKMQ